MIVVHGFAWGSESIIVYNRKKYIIQMQNKIL